MQNWDRYEDASQTVFPGKPYLTHVTPSVSDWNLTQFLRIQDKIEKQEKLS